jgi:response regulator RpfG family c-di-GMP phosphodiesterase
MNEKILFVDDDPNILEAYERRLGKALRVDVARCGALGLQCILKDGPYAVVVADMQMPLMNGIDFLARVKEVAPDTTRIMLTGNADLRVAMQAVNTGGIFRFLTKPCPADVMGEALVAGINQYRLVKGENNLLENTLNGAIEVLIEILSCTYPEAFGQALELRNRARAVARELKVENPWEIELAAMLSQLGYMLLPRDILDKMRGNQPLSDTEKAVLVRFPEIGQGLIERIPRLECVAQIILYQNKYFDGAGFPDDQVAEHKIPLGARILKVLIDLRSHEAEGMSRKEALELLKSAGGKYDKRVLAATTAYNASVPKTTQLATEPVLEARSSALKVDDVLVEGTKTKDGKLPIDTGR